MRHLSLLWTCLLCLSLAATSIQAQVLDEGVLGFETSMVPGELVVSFRSAPGERPRYIVLKGVPADVVATAGVLNTRQQLKELTQLAHPYLPRRAQEREITGVSPNYKGRLQWQYVPNDPLYPQQWYLPRIEMPDAWAFHIQRLAQGRVQLGTIIAVIDSGLIRTPDMPDLQIGCFLTGRNTVAENTDTTDDPNFAYGTFLAGIIRASINNGEKFAGMHFDACLLPVKVSAPDGSIAAVDLAEGVVFAADRGAKTATLAMAGLPFSQVVQDAVSYAQTKGVVLVAAAGQQAVPSSECTYPTCYEGVLGVGGTDMDNTLNPFSNFGPNMDVVAPIVGCAQTFLGGSLQDLCAAGTSASTAQVAAVAAYLRSLLPSMPRAEVISRIVSTAKDLGAPGSGDPEGAGFRLLDANAAMRSVP